MMQPNSAMIAEQTKDFKLIKTIRDIRHEKALAQLLSPGRSSGPVLGRRDQ
jgi:hypothetical protein